MMKKIFVPRILVALAVFFTFAMRLSADNTEEKVAQVAGTVSLTTDVDYVITGATPFADNGVVDIQNTEHAVVIFEAVKPSAALKLLAAHVKINGEKAVNGTNCQVKLYNRGAIILPYGDDFKPLTVYSEQKFEGESSSDFTIGHNGSGYMKTLPSAWNNRIRSFKLKRGYMVTFSTLANGRGYSRCFVAAYADRQLAVMPSILDGFITSYRIFKWYDAGKKQLANYMDKDALNALNVQSSYDWGQGNSSFLPDYEWVPNHIKEDWPSSSTIGSTSQSPNCKTNNEPRNEADDTPQDLTTILNNWENMMATGLRLCSPASWDGSDYWNATGFLAEFLDSIDARGWRCDIIDLHCYWPEGNFGNVNNWANKYKRPIWISEWCWGASWNNNGAFASGVTEQNVKDALQRICTGLNSNQNVERYYYWNSERDPSRLYKNGTLTPAGQYYSDMNSGLGYKKDLENTPKNPPMKAPSNLKVAYDKTNMKATVTWSDANGEWNKSMVVERSTDGGKTWTAVKTVNQNELPTNYSYIDADSRDGYRYRVHLVDLDGKDRYSGVGICVLKDASTGDGVSVGDKVMYIGGNMIVNGDFEMGYEGWTNGTGATIGTPNFELMEFNSPTVGKHLFSWTNMSSSTSAGALNTKFTVEPQAQYYFSVMLKNTGGPFQAVTAGTNLLYTTTKVADWTLQAGNFNTGDNTEISINFRSLDKAEMDNFILCRLFDSQDEAIADGVKQTIARARVFILFNNKAQGLNTELQRVIDATTGSDRTALETVDNAVAAAFEAYRLLPSLDELLSTARNVIDLGLLGKASLQPLVAEAATIDNAAEVSSLINQLNAALKNVPSFTLVNAIQNASFGGTTGWVKSGTYTGGDQRKNEVLDKTCWNAWWSVSTADAAGKTLAVEQVLTNMPEGFYFLRCVATTEHCCLSDQHAFIKTETTKAISPYLTSDRFDYPNVGSNAWEDLRTNIIYVSEGQALTIGFESSKQGAVDGAYVNDKGKDDNREGWWCATDFKLLYLPVYARTAAAEGPQWGTICLPQAVTPGDGVRLFEVAGSLTEGDNRYVCLSPLENGQEAGYPAVFYAKDQKAFFFTEGEAVKLSKEGPNTLYGNFTPTLIYSFETGAIGSIVMENNNWRELTEADFAEGFYTVPKNEASLYTFADLTPLQSWDGIKMPVNGTGIVDNIAELPVSSTNGQQEYFTIDGRRATANMRGLMLIHKDGKVRKVIRGR
ncbi:MAG: hypothetical protein IJ081_00275 [Prevotella sp.]|nr:hypothetical protein [Prevotella sp.]